MVLIRHIVTLLTLLAAIRATYGCKCGCALKNLGGGCAVCKPCGVVEGWDKAKEAAAKAGDVLDQAKAVASDPTGYIRNTIVNNAQDLLIPPQLEQALGVSNVCNTREKEAFGSDGWRPYFGKRLWDARGVGMVVGTFFPATAAVAANELLDELKAQYASAMAMLEQAAKDAGDDLKAEMTKLINRIIDGANSGKLLAPEFDSKTFGIKGAIIRVSCSNQAAGFKLPSEGYYQLAFAYRIQTPTLQPIAGVPPTPPAAPAAPVQPAQVCKHDCKQCGQDGPCAFGKCTGACRKCCWTP